MKWLDFLPPRVALSRHRNLIVAVVLRELELDFGDFVGSGRHPRSVLARRATAALLRLRTTMSFPEIARTMGRSNHSSVMTQLDALRRELESIDRSTIRRGAPAMLRELTPQAMLTHLDEAVAKEISAVENQHASQPVPSVRGDGAETVPKRARSPSSGSAPVVQVPNMPARGGGAVEPGGWRAAVRPGGNVLERKAMTTNFVDGPAQGTKLFLARAPMVLRVVINPRGVVDALDLPGDTPEDNEKVYLYIMHGAPGSAGIVCSRGAGARHSTVFQSANYRLAREQPGQDVLANPGRWREWANNNRAKLEAEYSEGFAAG